MKSKSEPRVHWIRTDKHVYGAIYREHMAALSVFGTVSDPEGTMGEPLMMTEWGFSGACVPLLKYEDWNRRPDRYCYYVACVVEGSE
jgi:hypothetical protein